MTQPPSKARRTQYVQSPVSETNRVRPTTPSTSVVATRWTTSLLRSTPAAARGRTRGKLGGTWAYRESEAKTHTTTPVVRGARLSMCRKCSHTGERQQLKRKHCESVSTTQTFDTVDPDQQHIMQPQFVVGGRQEELWNRWRRLEPRKKRRTSGAERRHQSNC
jgi:hypothetical protein